MRVIQTTVYKFAELTDKAKQNAIEIERYANDNASEDAWENTKTDAEQVGLEITLLSSHKTNKGDFEISAEDTANRILKNHGAMCETYKTASSFLEDWNKAKLEWEANEENEGFYFEDETDGDELVSDFLQALLEDYRIMYNQTVESYESDEYISEQLTENDYEFTETGEMI